MKASVILAFYNDVALLELALGALEAQYEGQFDVHIADDGSSAQAQQAVEALLSNYSFHLSHHWHADQGFRKTVILNQAVQASQGDWLIFLDADCVVQAQFVNDHLRHARAGVCLTGRRVDVFRQATQWLECSKPDQIIRRNWPALVRWAITKRARNIEKGWRSPWLAKHLRGRPWGALGCNFSMHREDLLAINGFDERHNEQWGAEDSDVQRRLGKMGVSCQSLRYLATMIHFDGSFFTRGPSADAERRWQYYRQAEAENRIWTPYGILKEDRPDTQHYSLGA